MTRTSVLAVGLVLLTVGVWSSGCATPPEPQGRAALWSSRCGGCHYMRSPSSFSDANWDLVVHHMRVRAYLTPDEAEAIAEFLKAGN